MAYPKKVPCKSGKYSIYVHYMKPTGKRYVGCTGQEPSRRFQNGVGYEKNPTFSADIKKYGWGEVETTIVAETEDVELAYCFENAAIIRYETLDPEKGYNHISSGKENKPNDSVGNKISKAKMGHEVTEETREKLRHYGCIPVVQLDLDGNYVCKHESMTAAANSVGAFKTNIWAVCEGRKVSCKGYKWLTLSEYNNGKCAEESDRVKHSVPCAKK